MAQAKEKRSNTAAGIAMRVGTVVVFVVLQAALLFGGASRLDWPWAWVYIGISLATVAVGGAIMLRSSPETIAERGRPGGMRGWDRVVSGVWLVAGFLALPLVAGLDARFGWTRALSAGWHVAGAVVLVVGYGLTVWAMWTNAYFSTAVRIQGDRGHAVCSSGPYRYVRHSGYVGYALQYLAMPFLLGSLWALLPWLAAAILDIDTVSPHFALGCLEALKTQAHHLHGLDVAFHHIPYDWQDTGGLIPLLSNKKDCILMCTSEGGLFEYGVDQDIIRNLNVLYDHSPAGTRIAGTIVHDATKVHATVPALAKATSLVCLRS